MGKGGGRGSQKNNIFGDCLKREVGLDILQIYRGEMGRGLARKRGVVYLRRVDETPMHTMGYLTLAGGQFIK